MMLLRVVEELSSKADIIMPSQIKNVATMIFCYDTNLISDINLKLDIRFTKMHFKLAKMSKF